MKALINVRIYDYHNYRKNSYIVFSDKIEEVGPMFAFKKSDKYDEIIDLNNSLVMPGFVCGHTHLYSAFARGMSIPFNPTSFKEVLEQMWWKLDHFLSLDMVYNSALSFGLEQLKKGTTTLIDHHAGNQIRGSLNQIKKALNDDLKVRSILCFETSDRYSVEDAINENVEYIKNNKSEFTTGLFGLHASFTLSDETLKKISRNLNNSGIHIHVSESVKDEEDSVKKYNKSVIKRLNDFNLINDKSILVHCTNVPQKDFKIISEKNATVAINVTSNMNNAVGLPNIRLMEENNIKMMIGNDGLIQSMPIEYLNAYYTAHLKTKNPIGFSLDSIKQMIINSYEFASKQLDIKLGRIKKGYKADLITIPYSEFTPLKRENVFGHIFFGVFPGLLPENIFVNGNQLINNYKASDLLERKNLDSINQAKKLWNKIKKEGNNLEFKD